MVSKSNNTMLVNFRCPTGSIAWFDSVCTAAGQTRTEVLLDLMERYSLAASGSIRATKIDLPSNPKIDSERVSSPISAETGLPSSKGGNGVQNRSLKGFLDFFRLRGIDPIVGGSK